LQATVHSIRPDVVANPGNRGTVIPAKPPTPFKVPSTADEGMLSMMICK